MLHIKHLVAPSQIIHPILDPEQILYRSKYFKNWGIYKVFQFKNNGQPTWFISSFALITVFIGFLSFLLLKVLLFIPSIPLIHQIGMIFLAILNAVFLLRFYHLNPNIESNCLPVLSEQQFRNQANYCSSCKIFKQMQIIHCPKCKVCISNQLFHSNLFNCCITKSNIKAFIGICIILCCIGVYSFVLI